MTRYQKQQSQDFFYKDLTSEEANEAGFFEERFDILDFEKPKKNETLIKWVKRYKKPAILLFCGCFAPFHSGHLNALLKAKECLETVGFDGVFGLIAPDHDEYVSTKTKYPIDERIKVIEKVTCDIEWLHVYEWPGKECNGAVNFTTVINKLQKEIDNSSSFIPIFLIVGGDNARFALTFKNKGGCIIIGRPGYEENIKKYSYLIDNQRIFYIDGQDLNSSTKIRKSSKKNLILRVDDSDPREVAIAQALRPYFNGVQRVYVREQRERFNSYFYKPVISLDPLIQGDYNFAISRNYDFKGEQQINWVSRPETRKSLLEQVIDIPKGEYYLFDDDIITGGTINFAADMLAFYGIKILSTFSLTNSRNLNTTEVLDARDFIFGHPNGGLVIHKKRYPYILPFVNPEIRASVLNGLEFSTHIWDVNEKLPGFPGKDVKKQTIELYLKNINKGKYGSCIHSVWHY